MYVIAWGPWARGIVKRTAGVYLRPKTGSVYMWGTLAEAVTFPTIEAARIYLPDDRDIVVLTVEEAQALEIASTL